MTVHYSSLLIWDKVFKSGPCKICGRRPLKILKEFFKGSLPQILLGPLLNTLSHLSMALSEILPHSKIIKNTKNLSVFDENDSYLVKTTFYLSNFLQT